MGRLTAEMVVDLKDKSGSGTRSALSNLDRLKRADRQFAADRVQNNRAMERLMLEREQSIQERQARMNAFLTRGALAASAAGYVGARAFGDYADTERRINRILINADKSKDALQPTVQMLQAVGKESQLGFAGAAEGLETLVASGRSLEEALAFLPSVAITAQASGSAVSDIALSADALGGSMKIAGKDMQKAFDMLVTGGKLGKFELKDMAQYLPSLLPAFAALGYEGTEGLAKMVAMLQTVRMQTGTSSEAATNLGNVLGKMYSEETGNKFKKFGINLRKELDKAKKDGKDVIEVFLDMVDVATKGDLSKLTVLFSDAQMQAGVRALFSLRSERDRLVQSIRQADGSTMRDFQQATGDAKGAVERLNASWDQFWNNVGRRVSKPISITLDYVSKGMDDGMAIEKSQEGLDAEQLLWRLQDFSKRYSELYPKASITDLEKAYDEARAKLGRGEAKTVFDGLATEEGRRKGGARTKAVMEQIPDNGRNTQPAEFPGLTYDGMPVPRPRPSPDEKAASVMDLPRYPGRGSYDPEVVKSWKAETERRAAQSEADRRAAEIRRLEIDTATALELDTARRGRQFGFGGTTETIPGKLADDRGVGEPSGPREVMISGTPAVTVSGPVTIANPTRPNVTNHVVVNVTTNADPHQIGNAVANAVVDKGGMHDFSPTRSGGPF